jgi:ParB family chromosome partitioning protein
MDLKRKEVRKMSEKENLDKKYEKPVFEYLPINIIKIPDLRVTAEMPDDLLEQFKESIKKSGIKNPLKILYQNGEYILVDGLHRLIEAKMANQKEVPCVVVKGTLEEALLENLATGKLQGRGKVTDMIKVVKYLHNEKGMSIEEIAAKSGYKTDYLYDLLAIANAHPDLLLALDEEKIPLGAAKELARVPIVDVMLKMLYEVIYRRMTVRDVKEYVDLTLEALELKKKKEEEAKKLPPRELVPVTCWVCGQEAPAKDMVSFLLCPRCQAVLFDYKAKIRAEEYERAKAMVGTSGKKENEGKKASEVQEKSDKKEEEKIFEIEISENENEKKGDEK